MNDILYKHFHKGKDTVNLSRLQKKIIDAYPSVTPVFDTLEWTMEGEAFPETLHSSLELAVPLFNDSSISEGLVLKLDFQSSERPEIPWFSIDKNEGLILAGAEN